ncbi:MAG: DNRLRE domain-containing protein, partial [Thaumarchaeota archaeon]|nr:DNRLRE domain-containing protein [Nitrososphaerota archaeon]
QRNRTSERILFYDQKRRFIVNYLKTVVRGVVILSVLLTSIFISSNGIQFVRATSSITEIAPTDDAYVVADSYDPQDRQGFQHTNTGHLPFLKAWYAWDVTKAGKERIISITYLKFNLTKINGPIESASLVLHPFVVNLTVQSRPVDIYTGLNSNWNESSIVFVGAPAFSTADNSTDFISNSDVNKSVSWDVTRQVRSHEDSLLTLALVLRNSYPHNEELVDFYSKEASDPNVQPDLIVVTQPQSQVTQMTDTNSGTGNTSMSSSEYAYFAITIAAIVTGFIVLKRKNKHRKTPAEDKVVTKTGEIPKPDTSDHSTE